MAFVPTDERWTFVQTEYEITFEAYLSPGRTRVEAWRRCTARRVRPVDKQQLLAVSEQVALAGTKYVCIACRQEDGFQVCLLAPAQPRQQLRWPATGTTSPCLPLKAGETYAGAIKRLEKAGFVVSVHNPHHAKSIEVESV